MKIVPLFKCSNMKEAIAFYTGILDFELKYPGASSDDWVLDLVNGDAELQLTILEGDYLFGSVANIWVSNIDTLFSKYLERGLDTSNKKESPVHQGPTNQSWGTREFYVTDKDGNTLRFCMLVKEN
jgi:catechol 2,3-dioxygenase-like lactoylglutathione lyase family enzyme